MEICCLRPRDVSIKFIKKFQRSKSANSEKKKNQIQSEFGLYVNF